MDYMYIFLYFLSFCLVIIIKFQIPPNVNKYFDNIYYEIKQSNSKKIDDIIKELNCLTYIKVKMIISLEILYLIFSVMFLF